MGLEGGFTLRDGELRFELRRSPGGLRKTCSGERASRIPSSYRLGRSPALKCVKTISCSLARWRICPSDEVWVPVASTGSLWYLLLGLQVPEGGTRRPVC